MSGAKSKRKGSGFERKVSDILTEWSGVPLRRTPMSGGWSVGAADICCEDGTDFLYAVECKNAEGWDFHQILTGAGGFFKWLDQTLDQAKDREPILIFSSNFKPVYVCVRASSVKGMLKPPHAFVRVYHRRKAFVIMPIGTFIKCVPYGQI